jgi:hypothetical protein
VLEPIHSAEQRALLDADFYMSGRSVGYYCLFSHPEDIGIEPVFVVEAQVGGNDHFCFSIDE